MKQFKIALCQILPDRDVFRTAGRAYVMIDEAVRSGAGCIVFPEMFYTEYNLQLIKKNADAAPQILDGFISRAVEKGVTICTGSMAWQVENGLRNRSHLIGPDGSTLLVHDKCHLFDVALETVQVRESALFTAGESVATADTPFGRTGILVCYDIRFPEIAREVALQGAELLLVPAVFNQQTGSAHWHHFVRTRAVENQLFLAAVSTARSRDAAVYQAYGHSMVVSPWGDILAEAGEDECIIYADCDPAILTETRKKLPLLQHRRVRLYTSFRR